MTAKPDHRGRWQAQGGALQESEAWAQADPLTASDGKDLLARLENRLSPADRALRQVCFQRAREFVDRAALAGGIDATYIRSFPAPGDGTARRVDVEVRAGKAFIP